MTRLSTALRLGVANVVRALAHQTFRRAGIYKWLLPRRQAVPLRVDSPCAVAGPPAPFADRSVLTEAEHLLDGKANYFSVHAQDISNPPDWFLNPFQDNLHQQTTLHW